MNNSTIGGKESLNHYEPFIGTFNINAIVKKLVYISYNA